MRKSIFFLGAIVSLFFASPAVNAQTTPQTLPALIRSARNAFRPISPATANSRRAELMAAVDRLDRYLVTGGTNGNNWKRFLRWDEMRAELHKGPSADLDVLEDIQTLYSSGYAGFELPIYADAGRALRRYIDTQRTIHDREARSHFEARIDALAEDVEAYMASPATADTQRAGEILGELAASGQAPNVIQKVRQQLSHPNLLIEADEGIVAAGIEDPVNDVGPLTDVILGTRISGTVQTVGYVNAELGNTAQYAAIDILMTGTAYSNTVGYNGPAVIHSSAVTGLAGRKRLVLDANGLRSFPAASNARTSSTINGIGVNANFMQGLVQKIATKRVYQSKSQAEAIGSQHAQVRLNTRMDAQSLNLIAQGNRDFWNKFRYPLMRVGAFPEQMQFSSLGDRLIIRATRADTYQLAAPTAPPQISAADVSVRLHESTVDNFASTALSGRTLTRDEMNRLMKNLTGRIPEELQDEEMRDWSITFAVEKPIELAIADGGLRVTIRGDEYTAGENTYPAMNVTANYKLDKNDQGGLRAVRQGELEIYPPDFKPGVDQLSSSQQSLKTILERRFGKLFKPELPDKPTRGLELSGRWKSLGPLPISVLTADNGWLALGWSRPATARRSGSPMPAPAIRTASLGTK
jgi:hypothetical protein